MECESCLPISSLRYWPNERWRQKLWGKKFNLDEKKSEQRRAAGWLDFEILRGKKKVLTTIRLVIKLFEFEFEVILATDSNITQIYWVITSLEAAETCVLSSRNYAITICWARFWVSQWISLSYLCRGDKRRVLDCRADWTGPAMALLAMKFRWLLLAAAIAMVGLSFLIIMSGYDNEIENCDL